MKNDLLDHAFNVIIDSGASSMGAAWYLFGSSLKSQWAEDIDLLVLYDDNSHPKQIRTLLLHCMSYLQLDLIFLKHEEERELNFIQSQECVQIFENAEIAP